MNKETKTEVKSYKIDSLESMMQIPVDRLDDFLKDLKSALISFHEENESFRDLVKSLQSFGENVIELAEKLGISDSEEFEMLKEALKAAKNNDYNFIRPKEITWFDDGVYGGNATSVEFNEETGEIIISNRAEDTTGDNANE